MTPGECTAGRWRGLSGAAGRHDRGALLDVRRLVRTAMKPGCGSPRLGLGHEHPHGKKLALAKRGDVRDAELVRDQFSSASPGCLWPALVAGFSILGSWVGNLLVSPRANRGGNAIICIVARVGQIVEFMRVAHYAPRALSLPRLRGDASVRLGLAGASAATSPAARRRLRTIRSGGGGGEHLLNVVAIGEQ